MIAIVDDEEKEQQIIKKYIEEWASARKEPVEFQCFANSENFLFHWEDNKCYDLLVLDIEMGKMNGLDLARKIRTENEKLPIIFVTGYDEYMQYGYDVSALHYLIKPVNKDRLFQALDKWKQRSDKEDETVLVNAEGSIQRLQLSKVMYVEANGHGSIIHTIDKVLSARESFGILEKQMLSTQEFVKCHRAFLVNLRYVSSIQNAELVLDDGASLPVSRLQMKHVQQAFLKYYRRQE